MIFLFINKNVNALSLKIIAEIGNNHNGSIELAKLMSASAIESGADFIKFQVYDIDSFISPQNNYYNDLRKESLNQDDFRNLKYYIEDLGGEFLATPFDHKSLKFLRKLGMKLIKISSGDFNNMDLIEQAIKYNMKLIVSLGGANTDEIDEVVKFLQEKKANFTLLHCVLAYPAKMEDVNLSFIETLRNKYGIPVGYSDHTLGIEASLGAIALGAEIIEKHFTTNQSLPGGDNNISILPKELRRLCIEGKNIRKAIGRRHKTLSHTELAIKKLVQRVYHAKLDINKGRKITDDYIQLLRPGKAGVGFFSAKKDYLLTKRASRNIKTGEIINQNDLI
jgi:N,N'-diacetyllegionaminate synthase